VNISILFLTVLDKQCTKLGNFTILQTVKDSTYSGKFANFTLQLKTESNIGFGWKFCRFEAKFTCTAENKGNSGSNIGLVITEAVKNRELDTAEVTVAGDGTTVIMPSITQLPDIEQYL
jgi:hypothetical protein